MKSIKLYFFLLPTLLIFLGNSCTKGNEDDSKTSITQEQNDCIERIINKFGYERYNGEDLNPCKLFLNMYKYNETLYFSSGGYCVKYAPHLYDCFGESINLKDPAFFNANFDKINQSFVSIIAYKP